MVMMDIRVFRCNGGDEYGSDGVVRCKRVDMGVLKSNR